MYKTVYNRIHLKPEPSREYAVKFIQRIVELQSDDNDLIWDMYDEGDGSWLIIFYIPVDSSGGNT